MLLDALASSAALFLAFLIRFEFSIPENFLSLFFSWIPWFILVQCFVFYFSDLYARIWRYTSLFDLYAIVSAVTTASAASVILIFIFFGTSGYPRSVLLLYYILNCIASISIRLSVRVYYSHYHKEAIIKSKNQKKLYYLLVREKLVKKLQGK